MSTFGVGRTAEEIALAYERCLAAAGNERFVRLDSSNPGVGYDLEVVGTGGGTGSHFKAIEVKAWNENGHCIVSMHEIETLKKLGNLGWIYLVDVKRERVVRMIQNPFEGSAGLEPLTFKFYY